MKKTLLLYPGFSGFHQFVFAGGVGVANLWSAFAGGMTKSGQSDEAEG